MPRLDGEHHLAPIAQGGDHHQQRRLVFLQTRLDVDPVGPQVDRLEADERALPPRFVLGDPLAAQPLDRARRQRRPVAEQAAQCQLEVPLRQPMQVEPRQQLADLLGAPLEQWQHRALEALFQTAHPRPSHLDRAAGQGQSTRLSVAVAVDGPGLVADHRPALALGPPDQLAHLFLQQPLDEPLDLLARHRLQLLPDAS